MLNHIEAFVAALARTELHDRHTLTGRDGAVRAVVPGRGWADHLELAVTEIRDYGASSTQVCRRLRAAGRFAHDGRSGPPVRRADELCRLGKAVEAAFPDPVARWQARGSDSLDYSRPGR
jgi:hypothetical protein